MNKIRFTVCTLAVSCVLAIGGFAQATSFGPISDNYWGGTPYDNSARDIVGTNEGYDIVSISGNITKSLFSVTIKSNYFDNIGSSGTALGDFFISTNGWNPIGTAADHYQNDTLNNGEKWEFALVFDHHTPTNTSGNLSLYSLSPNNYSSEVKLSNSFFGSNAGIRKDQEVQVNTTEAHKVNGVSGSWFLDTSNLLLTLTLQNYDFHSSDFGFHWGMTCANDIIEAGVKLPSDPVPEPATMLLFGTGLAGLAGFSRSRKK